MGARRRRFRRALRRTPESGQQRVDTWSLADAAQGCGIKGLNTMCTETSAPPGWHASYDQRQDQPGQLSFSLGKSKTGLEPGAALAGFAIISPERAPKLLSLFWAATIGEKVETGRVQVSPKGHGFDPSAPRGWYFVADESSSVEVSTEKKPDGSVAYTMAIVNTRHEPEGVSNVALMLDDNYRTPENAGCGKKLAEALGKPPRLLSPTGWRPKVEADEVLWEAPNGVQLEPGAKLTGFGFVLPRGRPDLASCVQTIFNWGGDTMGMPKMVMTPGK